MKAITCSNKSKQTHAGRFPGGSNTMALLSALALALGWAVPLHAQEAVKLGIANSVLLNWPEPTNECIVVGTDLPTNSASVWMPWPEPIFKRGNELCMAVPTSAPRQFFQLVAGSQFIDDFSEPREPFATRSPWVPYFWGPDDSTKYSFVVTNGGFRIQTLGPPVDGRIFVAPPGTLPILADFTASVDILNFTASGWAGVGLYGRGTIATPPSNSNGLLRATASESGGPLIV